MGGRLPPNLLYLTIYNPTLRPSGPIPEDDEDAEEQAHILFYTAKERAVSRDRMLRQVGLAKALVNFSQMFNTDDACNNIHSQSNRMVMVSPEPDFWIHAAIEVARVARSSSSKGKGKASDKSKAAKDKGKEVEVVYDYIDGSVHDIAIRQAIQRAYERFKLTHGSFTQILNTLGQEALELQLERFFTIWAWSWNLEDGQEFREHLGIPLHPSYRTIEPVLDELTNEISPSCSSLFILPPHFVSSTKYKDAFYPSSLAKHLGTLIPPSPITSPPLHTLEASVGTIRGNPTSDPNDGKDPPYPPKTQEGPPPSSLGMPGVQPNVDMKWKWPDYLTFGRGASRKASPISSDAQSPQPSAGAQAGAQESQPLSEKRRAYEEEEEAEEPSSSSRVDIDSEALKDAISESITPVASPTDSSKNVGLANLESSQLEGRPSASLESTPTRPLESSEAAVPPADLHQEQSVTDDDPVPELKSTLVHLGDVNASLETVKQKVFYTSKNGMLIALVGLAECCVDESIAKALNELLEEVEDLLIEEQSKTISDSLPSATKILQPTDTHIITFPGESTLSNTEFTSKSGQLYSAQEMQNLDPDISEIFSRGQNPQHWHILRRGLGSNEDGSTKEGEVYMAVYRKEASLGDVDNVLAGVVRRCYN